MKRVNEFSIVLICIILILLCCTGTCADSALSPIVQAENTTIPSIPVSGLQEGAGTATASFGITAHEYLTYLTDEIGARYPGSVEEQEASEYIASVLEEMGYTVSKQSFSFISEYDEAEYDEAEYDEAEYDEAEYDETLYSQNVIAQKQGLSNKTVLVCAHYDSSDEGDGADDNAASVAIMLELAEQLQEVQTPYTIQFVFFGSEENDLDGSGFFVKQMDQSERRNTIGMINIDSIIAGDILYLYGDEGVIIRDCIFTTAPGDDIDLETKTAEELDYPDGTPCDCADYSSFQAAGIPFAYLEATNWEEGEKDGMTQVEMIYGDDGEIRHTHYDTTSYIDATFPGRIDERLDTITRLLYHSLTGCTGPEVE